MNNEDMSDIFEKLNSVIDKDKISPDMINNLMNMLGNSNGENKDNYDNSENNSSRAPGGIDIETLLKIKTIMDKMNTHDDPRSTLLQSLKPYLNENRKNKIDQYIKLMNMSKVIEILPFLGGDKTNNGKQ